MSETLLGVIIGSSLSIFGLLISALLSILIEHIRSKQAQERELKQKKEQAYIKIYKAYHNYLIERDASEKNKIAEQIYGCLLEIEIYGSNRIWKLIENIKVDDQNFRLNIDTLKSAIRKELGVTK